MVVSSADSKLMAKMRSTDFGKRLLPDVVDYLAQTDTNRIYASIPRSENISDGFNDINMVSVAAMVNRMSWWLNDVLARSDPGTIAYVGPADLRYPIMFLAAVKCKCKMLFISPRNRTNQNAGMLRKTRCKALFHAETMSDIASKIRAEYPEVLIKPVSPITELLNDRSDVAHYALDGTFDELKDEQCLILHSSGSTGDPKLVGMTHGTLAVTDHDRYMPTPKGRKPQNGAQFDFNGGGRYYSCFPPYHLAGVQAFIIQPILSMAATVVLGPPSLPPSGCLLAEIMAQQSLRAFYAPPFMIEKWASERDTMQQAKRLDFILFGGGPLSSEIGDRLSDVTNVCQMYGSLETGQIQLLLPQPGQWQYLEFNPFEEVDMQPVSDGLFEAVLHQSPRHVKHRSLSHNFPDIQTWRTGDLFAPHPTKTGLWRFDSRTDDLIVLSTGYKIRPLVLESAIQGDPSVHGALIVGKGRPQPVLLVEPKPGVYDGDTESFIRQIWPTISRANLKVASQGQLSRSRIVIASAQKPFERAPKGTIIRTATSKLYEDEVEKVFAESDDMGRKWDNMDGRQDLTLPDLEQFIWRCVREVLPDHSLAADENFFLNGLDSLTAVQLVKKLRAGLRSHMEEDLGKLSIRFLYRYPTVDLFADAITTVISGHDPDESVHQRTLTDVARSVEEFSSNLAPTVKCTHPRNARSGIKIALLGPRGHIGPHVLEALLQDVRVAKIYCLGRGSDGRELLLSSFHDQGLGFHIDESRLSFMSVVLGRPKLGLSEASYEELRSNTDLIIHNAWKTDFNLSLDAFKCELIPSVRDLIELSNRSARRPRIVFVSSVASVQGWALEHSAPVNEEPLPSHDVVAPSGYGQSKHVAEQILVRASEETKTPVTILRLGQVGGPTMGSGGCWSKDELMPSLATLSKLLKLVPSDLPLIDWIPVDQAARAVCESSLPRDKAGPECGLRVCNLVNPCPAPWSTFTKVLRKRIGCGTRLVPLKDWVTKLAAVDLKSVSEEEAVTIVKLVPVFRNLVETAVAGKPLQASFKTENARAVSETMRGMGAVDEDLIDVWCAQWGI